MITKLTTLFSLIIIFTSFLSSVDAAEEAISSLDLTKSPMIDITYESVNPPNGSPYLFKRIREKISIFFAFSNKSKVQVYKKLVNVRLAELKYVIEKKEMGYFEQTTKRYFTTVGQLTEFLILSRLEDEFIPVKDELLSHLPVLIKLRDTYDSSTAEWRFVEDDVNYVKGYINDLSE